MASLHKNVASQNISFALVNASTGAALTGATFTSAAWVSKDNSQAGFAGTFTELGNGQYNYAPTQAETNCTSFGLAINPSGSIIVNIQIFTDVVDANGLASVNTVDWNGTAVASPATAGIPDVNVKNMNNVAATSITTINANVGTTQPTNFSGTGASAFVKSDTEQLNAQAVTAAAGVTFPASVASPTNITAGTITTVTNLTNAATAGDLTATMKTSVTTAATAATPTAAAVTGAVGSVTGNVGGNVVGSVGSVTGAVGSVTGNVGGNVTGSVGSVAAAVNVGNWNGTAVSAIPPDAIFLRNGTAQAGGASSITLDSGASATDNLYKNCIVFIRSGTGAGQSNVIASYVGSTKVATMASAWATNPDSSSVFSVAAFGPSEATVAGTVTANVTQWNGTNVAAPATAGIPEVNVKNINNVSASSVTTVAANQGTTQPVNFSGSGASAFVKADAEQVNGQSTSAAGTVTFPGSIALPTNITAGTITTVTNLTNAPTAGDLTATMKTSVTTAATAATPTAAAVTAGVTVSTNNDKTGYALTQAFPTNFATLAIDGSGRIDLGKILGAASSGAAGYVGIRLVGDPRSDNLCGAHNHHNLQHAASCIGQRQRGR